MRGSVVKHGAGYSVVVELERDPETGKRRQKWHSGCRTKRAAEAAAVQGGTYVEPNRQTVAEFLDDWLSAVALLVFLAGALLTPIVLGVGLWRAHALPWWAAAGLVLWLAGVFVGSEATPAALVNLALLLPFAAVARHLSEPSATHRQQRRASMP